MRCDGDCSESSRAIAAAAITTSSDVAASRRRRKCAASSVGGVAEFERQEDTCRCVRHGRARCLQRSDVIGLEKEGGDGVARRLPHLRHPIVDALQQERQGRFVGRDAERARGRFADVAAARTGVGHPVGR